MAEKLSGAIIMVVAAAAVGFLVGRAFRGSE